MLTIVLAIVVGPVVVYCFTYAASKAFFDAKIYSLKALLKRRKETPDGEEIRV